MLNRKLTKTAIYDKVLEKRTQHILYKQFFYSKKG